MPTVITKYKADVSDFVKQTNKVKSALTDVAKGEEQVEKQGKKSFDNTGKSISKYDQSLGKAASTLKRHIGQFIAFGSAVAVINDAVKKIKAYEQAIADLGAITGKSGEQLDGISKAVLKVSANTGKGATDIAKAFQLVGSAQPELLKSTDALAAVTEQAVILSKAGGIEVPAAANALTKAMNQFGASAEDAAMFTDILATAQQKGTATIEQTAMALVNAGSAANAAGLSFEETNVGLQALAKGGQVGAEAGTALRQILVKLANQNDKSINPSMVGLAETVENLAARNLSLKDASELVGEEAAKSLLTLTAQKDVVTELTGALNENGNALAQAEARYDTITGKLEKTGSTYERFILEIEEGNGVIAQSFGEVLDFVNDFIEGMILAEKGYVNMINAVREESLSEQAKADRAEFDEFLKTLGKTNASMEERVELAKSFVQVDRDAIQRLREQQQATGELTEAQREQVLILGTRIKAIEAYARESVEASNDTKEADDAATTAHKKNTQERIEAINRERKTLKEQTAEFIEAWDEAINKQDEVALGSDRVKEATGGAAEAFKDMAEDARESFESTISNIEQTQQLFGQLFQISSDIFAAGVNQRIEAINREEELRTSAYRDELSRLNKQGELTEKEAKRKIELENKIKEQEDKFEAQRRQELRERASFERQLALFQVAIDTAASAGKTAAQLGYPAAIPFIALAITQGAARAALIATQPLPAFKDGEIDIDGPGTGTSDSILARISKGESVVNAKATKKNREELDAINQHRYEDLVYDKYVLPAMVATRKAVEMEQQKDFAESIAGSIALNFKALTGKQFSKQMRETMRHEENMTGRIVDALQQSQFNYRA